MHFYSLSHTPLLWFHNVNAKHSVCTDSKFNQGGLQLVMLVRVAILWRKGGGWSLLDPPTNPSARSHCLPASNANPPKGVWLCVPTCLCILNTMMPVHMQHQLLQKVWWERAGVVYGKGILNLVFRSNEGPLFEHFLVFVFVFERDV